MTAPRVWLVTGSSSGFGRETVVQALERGDSVIATLRNPSALSDLTTQYPRSRLRVVPLDVTSPAQIAHAFQEAKAAFGRVDVVFNNAGVEAVRFFREENAPRGGLLLQNSATVGLVGWPAVSFYAASKHALEGFSESLAKELDPAWNIKVVIVEPGAFKTAVLEKNMIVAPQHPAYATPTSPAYHVRGAFLKGAGKEADTDADLHPSDPTKAVTKIIELTTLPNPPLHFPLGLDAIAAIRGKLGALAEEIDGYASWSASLAK
ncbi:hypothetical protein BN946_scf184697.g25 [Trametes cinnabarina]|uniref:NAD(P)-binding protein n=1 Tax=Pycnoporus cinnabarinus TaxID=5643 RepID=A0A060SBJ7_PYCCI|nr:hypothetical protein BN946_scf184697.g25 [Trametes cinnabarina]